jgi:hypothetical protein
MVRLTSLTPPPPQPTTGGARHCAAIHHRRYLTMDRADPTIKGHSFASPSFREVQWSSRNLDSYF